MFRLKNYIRREIKKNEREILSEKKKFLRDHHKTIFLIKRLMKADLIDNEKTSISITLNFNDFKNTVDYYVTFNDMIDIVRKIFFYSDIIIDHYYSQSSKTMDITIYKSQFKK